MEERGFFLGLSNLYAGKGYRRFLLVPALLFLIFLFLALVWPAVPLGIDLEGGTLLVIRAEKELDSGKIEKLLSQNFDLRDLKVHSVSSPTGFGVNVQFAANRQLEAAQSDLDAAKAALASDPAAALQHARSAVETISPYLKETALPPDASEAVEQAESYLIEASKEANKEMQSLIVERFSLGEEVAFQRKDISPTLGESFWRTAFNVAVAAAVLITIVIFIFFRKVIPSLAVIGAAVFDIAGALALMAVFRIPLSLSSIPALLMLIGYSVDTDVMLTTRMLKRREKEPHERAFESMLTGLTMTGTTIAALTAMIAISYLNQIEVIFAIASVLLFGLLADLVSTWLMNAPVLLWYAEKADRRSFL